MAKRRCACAALLLLTLPAYQSAPPNSETTGGPAAEEAVDGAHQESAARDAAELCAAECDIGTGICKSEFVGGSIVCMGHQADGTCMAGMYDCTALPNNAVAQATAAAILPAKRESESRDALPHHGSDAFDPEELCAAECSFGNGTCKASFIDRYVICMERLVNGSCWFGMYECSNGTNGTNGTAPRRLAADVAHAREPSFVL